jgi:membrane protein
LPKRRPAAPPATTATNANIPSGRVSPNRGKIGPVPASQPEILSKLPPLGPRLRRIVIHAWDGFWADRCSLAAASLSYQTALALVPLLAIALALLKYSGQLEDSSRLLSVVVQQVFPSSQEAQGEVVGRLSTFSRNFTAGGLGSFGIVAALAVGFFLFLSVESIWNHIWESHRERTYIERFLLFYTGITLLPFVVTLSFVQTEKLWGGFAVFLPYLSPLLTTIMLSLANRLIPTLRVPWNAALAGGATAAVLLEISKFGLGRYLSWVATSYKSIYGALGVLPLFLLSIYLWWLIVLWGVEVSRAVQRLPWQMRFHDDTTSHDAQLTISGPLAARLLTDVARHFKLGSKSLPVDELMQRHGLPESVVRKILSRLAKQGLVIEHEDGYLLAKPPESIRLEEVLQLFQPVQYQHSETEPDQLDQVLAKLEKQQQESLGTTTFASLI